MDHNSLGFRFLSCSTASHLAPVPKIVMLEKKKKKTEHRERERERVNDVNKTVEMIFLF